MRNEKMVKEAIKRMRMIGLRDYKTTEDELIRTFEEKGKVFVSYSFLTELVERIEWVAAFRPLSKGEQKLVDEFENQYGALVYHAIQNTNGSEIGNCYAFLYVSKEESEWRMERACLEDMKPYSCPPVIGGLSISYSGTGKAHVKAYMVNAGRGYIRGDETELHGVGEVTSIEIEKPYASSIRPPSALVWRN